MRRLFVTGLLAAGGLALGAPSIRAQESESTLLEVGAMAPADPYAYLPLLALELALAWSAAELVGVRPRLRTVAGVLGLAWLGALALRTSDQLAHWRDSRALFEHALATTERNFVALNGLGLELVREGAMDEALARFEAAAAARSGFHEAEFNSGRARYERGDYALARAAFERAVAAKPESGEAHLYLGATLAREGELARAAEELAAALRAQPELETDPRTLGLRAFLAGRRRE